MIYFILLFIFIYYAFGYLLFGKPTTILDNYYEIMSASNMFMVYLVKVSIFILIAGGILLTIIKKSKSYIVIAIIILLTIIYGPIQGKVKEHINEEATNIQISDIIPTQDEFNTNSKYYFECVDDVKYSPYSGDADSGHASKLYNEETLKYEYYPVTYKLEITNIIDNKDIIESFLSCMDTYKKQSEINSAMMETNTINNLKYLPIDDEDYNIYLLTYMVEVEAKEGTEPFGYSLNKYIPGQIWINQQDNDVVLKKSIKEYFITCDEILKDKKYETQFNQKYVFYDIICVPNVYDNYDIGLRTRAITTEEYNQTTLDFKEMLEYFK